MKKKLSNIFSAFIAILVACGFIFFLYKIHKDASLTFAVKEEKPLEKSPEIILEKKEMPQITPVQMPVVPVQTENAVKETPAVEQSVKNEEKEYPEFYKYGIKPKEAKYYE